MSRMGNKSRLIRNQNYATTRSAPASTRRKLKSPKKTKKKIKNKKQKSQRLFFASPLPSLTHSLNKHPSLHNRIPKASTFSPTKQATFLLLSLIFPLTFFRFPAQLSLAVKFGLQPKIVVRRYELHKSCTFILYFSSYG